MNKETYEALKRIMWIPRHKAQKLGAKKRKTSAEVWESAVLHRDLFAVQNWIDEVSKEYQEGGGQE